MNAPVKSEAKKTSDVGFVLIIFLLLGVVAVMVYFGGFIRLTKNVAAHSQQTEVTNQASSVVQTPDLSELIVEPPTEPRAETAESRLEESPAVEPPADPTIAAIASGGTPPVTVAPDADPQLDPNAKPQALAAWQLYDDRIRNGDADWPANITQIIKPIGSAQVELVKKSKPAQAKLDGTYSITPPTVEGGATRLQLTSVQELRLGFWQGDEGAIVDLSKNANALQAFIVERTKGKEPKDEMAQPLPSRPSHVLIDSDQGLWKRAFSDGPLDICYEQGAVHLMRGDLRFLSIPMEHAPEQFLLKTKSVLKGIDHSLLPAKRFAERRKMLEFQQTTLPTADREWVVTPEEKVEVVITQTPGDALTFRAQAAKGRSKEYWYATTTLPYERGSEITMRIDAASVETGVVIAAPTTILSNRIMLYVGEHKGCRVISDRPCDRGGAERCFKKGWIVGETFWVRLTTGLDNLRIAFSNDGELWEPVRASPFAKSTTFGTETIFGVTGVCTTSQQSICVGEITVKRFEGLEQLVDKKLFQQALGQLKEMENREEEETKKKNNTKRTNWSSLLEALLDAAPEGIALKEWDYAVRLAMLTHSPHDRRTQLTELFHLALHSDSDWELVKPALMEFTRRFYLSQSFNWMQLAKLYDDAVRGYWSDRQLRKRIPDLADIWHWQQVDYSRSGKYHSDSIRPMPLVLARLGMYALQDECDWERLLDFSLRETYFNPYSRSSSHSRLQGLPSWMQSLAQSHLAIAATPTREQFAGHPLHTETLTKHQRYLFTEIEKAIDSQDWARAAKMFTREPFLDVASVFVADGDMQIPQRKILKKWITSHPQLVTALSERQQQQIGRLWLGRAIKESDLEQVEATALQFHRTPVGNDALAYLAARELSGQQFRRAASRYKTLVAIAPQEEKSQWEARRQLAMAFLGEKAMEQTTVPVVLESRTFSAEQFKRLIAITAEGKKKEQFVADPPCERLTLAKQGYTQKHQFAVPLSVRGRGNKGAGSSTIDEIDFGWVCQDDLLYVHTLGQMIAYNLRSGKVQFNFISMEKTQVLAMASVPRPLLFDNSTLIFPAWRSQYTSLVCLDKNNGKVIWQHALDPETFVLGEPVLHDGVLISFRLESDTSLLQGTTAELKMRRIDPRTGKVFASRKIADVDLVGAVFQMGRPLVYRDLLFVRIGASLVCCDLFGEVHWIRKLPYMPSDVESRAVKTRVLGELVLVPAAAGDRLLFAASGSRNIECCDAQTGKPHWTNLEPSLTQVVGVSGKRFVITTSEEIKAIDIETGKTVWQIPWRERAQSLLLTKDGHLLVTNDRDDPRGKEMPLLCFKVEDGSACESFPAAQFAVKGTRLILSAGQRIVGVRRGPANKKTLDLMVLEPAN